MPGPQHAAAEMHCIRRGGLAAVSQGVHASGTPRELVHLTMATRCGSKPAGAADAQRRSYTMFAFNGQQPGPLIEVVPAPDHGQAHQPLPQPTTVHWHGIRLDNPNDGTPGMTQPEVRLAASLSIGSASRRRIYWYHPHIRGGHSAERVSMETCWCGQRGRQLQRGNREAVLMLDDLLSRTPGWCRWAWNSPLTR